MEPFGNKILLLAGGAMGAGKTSFAGLLTLLLNRGEGVVVDSFTTDDFWYERGNGTYDFDPTYLGEAHSWNEARVEDCMLQSPVDHKEAEYHIIIVHNTFATNWETDKFIPYAEAHGFAIINPMLRHLHNNKSVHVKDPQIIKTCEHKIARSFCDDFDQMAKDVEFYKRELSLMKEEA